MNKSLSVEKTVSFLPVLLSVIGSVLFFFTKIRIPFPLAEIIAFTYSFLKGGKIIPGIILIVLYAACLVLFCLEKMSGARMKLIYMIPLWIVLTFDTFVHLYAFLFAKGYEFNYMISALLDIVMIILLFRDACEIKRKRVS